MATDFVREKLLAILVAVWLMFPSGAVAQDCSYYIVAASWEQGVNDDRVPNLETIVAHLENNEEYFLRAAAWVTCYPEGGSWPGGQSPSVIVTDWAQDVGNGIQGFTHVTATASSLAEAQSEVSALLQQLLGDGEGYTGGTAAFPNCCGDDPPCEPSTLWFGTVDLLGTPPDGAVQLGWVHDQHRYYAVCAEVQPSSGSFSQTPLEGVSYDASLLPDCDCDGGPDDPPVDPPVDPPSDCPRLLFKVLDCSETVRYYRTPGLAGHPNDYGVTQAGWVRVATQQSFTPRADGGFNSATYRIWARCFAEGDGGEFEASFDAFGNGITRDVPDPACCGLAGFPVLGVTTSGEQVIVRCTDEAASDGWSVELPPITAPDWSVAPECFCDDDDEPPIDPPVDPPFDCDADGQDDRTQYPVPSCGDCDGDGYHDSTQDPIPECAETPHGCCCCSNCGDIRVEVSVLVESEDETGPTEFEEAEVGERSEIDFPANADELREEMLSWIQEVSIGPPDLADVRWDFGETGVFYIPVAPPQGSWLDIIRGWLRQAMLWVLGLYMIRGVIRALRQY